MTKPLTVAQLIEHLLTLPQELPVAAYSACEDTYALTVKGISVDTDFRWYNGEHWTSEPHVAIIGG